MTSHEGDDQHRKDPLQETARTCLRPQFRQKINGARRSGKDRSHMEWPFHTFPPHRDDTLIPTLLLGRSRDIFDKQQHAIYKNKADFYFASTALIGAGSNIILPPMLNVSFLVNSGG